MGHWWHQDIVEQGKLPLALALAAFLVTYGVTRAVTRLIRAGHGPFRNMSTSGGVHVHHAVPGVLLILVGGFGALAVGRHHDLSPPMAIIFGVGVGLVLDEFALILYMSDVYWTENGRKSAEAVVLTAAIVGLLLLGYAPFGTDGLTDEERESRGAVVLTVGLNVLLALVALVKGKFRMTVIGVLVPFVALFGAVRLARPNSTWAKYVYRRRPRALKRARVRAERHDARWGTLSRHVENLVAGAPDRD